MGRQIQQCFEGANVMPKAYITSTYTQIGTTICFQRLAACFCSQMSLVNQKDQIPEDINIFPLYYQGKPVTQRLSLIRMKNRYLSHYSKFFLDLLSQYFVNVEQIRVERCVQQPPFPCRNRKRAFGYRSADRGNDRVGCSIPDQHPNKKEIRKERQNMSSNKSTMVPTPVKL